MLVEVIPNQGVLPLLSPWNRRPSWGRFTKYGKDHRTSRTQTSCRASWGRRMNGIFSVAPALVWSSWHQESSRSSLEGWERRKNKLVPLLSKREAGPYMQRVMSFIKGEQRAHSRWCRDRGIFELEKKSHWRIFWKTRTDRKRRTKMTEKPRCITKSSTFWFFLVAGKIKALVKFMTQVETRS